MLRKHHTLMCLALACLALPATSCAQSGAGQFLERADRDADGAIALAEWSANGSERFIRLDGNGDGVLDPAETAAARDGMRQRRGQRRPAGGMEGQLLSRADADGDGGLSKAEYAAAMTSLFGRLDTDGDGRITRGELQAIRQRSGGQRE